MDFTVLAGDTVLYWPEPADCLYRPAYSALVLRVLDQATGLCNLRVDTGEVWGHHVRARRYDSKGTPGTWSLPPGKLEVARGMDRDRKILLKQAEVA